MPREVNINQDFPEKLANFIPAEIVAAYLAIATILNFEPVPDTPAPSEIQKLLIKIVFFVLMVLTPLYLWKIAKVKNKLQLGASTISFAVWVYNLGGPFEVWKIYNADVAAVLLVLWSLIPPLLIKGDTPSSAISIK